MVWVRFLSTLDTDTSQRLLLTMANFDSLRSLVAQRTYAGDEAMIELWYSTDFLNAAEEKLASVRRSMKELRTEFRWQGDLPSSRWIADIVDEARLYDYLHSATSRAVHFSVGEIFRRGWGSPDGILITDKPEFREHCSEFSLDRLWRLLFETLNAGMPLLEKAGVSSSDALTDDTILPVLKEVLALGIVPLVHASEWHLSPEGPLRPPH